MLDTLFIHHQSAEGLISFRNFIIRRGKIKRAFCWLKENNQYYADIIINDNILCTLPNDGPVSDHLPYLRDADNKL